MLQSHEEKILRLERSILQYLIDHPEAKDTVEGICLAWLQGEEDEEAVRTALGRSEQRGWVQVRAPVPRGSLYMLNQQQLDEVKDFVTESKYEKRNT